MKRVTIGLTLDEEFIKLLDANVHLSRLRAKAAANRMEPIAQVALIVLAEARGATLDQIEQYLIDDWKGHFDIVADARKVEEI